jgi:putative hydrolase of the HAD superfamily
VQAGPASTRCSRNVEGGTATPYTPLMLRAVLFDVDFTLSRPGPELGPDAYRRVGAQHGLELDASRYEEARLAAMEDLRTHPELVHDEELWVAFTEDIVRGMGGDAVGSRECAADMVRRWEIHEYFHLYDDALPVMQSLREHRLAIGLISNGQRDLEEFAVHHMLDVDCAIGSKAHGRAKPHASIFERALSILDVSATAAVMVGDSYADDIEGARALGMRAILLDRDGRYPNERDRITDLFQLPVALGLSAP